MLRLFNSLTKSVEEFLPMHAPEVGMYTCGMTVYDFAHIGHGRKYVGDDILRRILQRQGYKVKHVQNVTDVGHLVSDADEGDDKLEKGAKSTGKTVWEVADFYTKHFYESMDKLNVLRPTIICKATEHIPEQIALVKTLIHKGFAYDTPEAVYFDISKFQNYDKLFGQNLTEKKTAVREGVRTGEFKKHPEDFALWFKRVGRFTYHTMHWESPWGDGFPGWHVECSAMSMKYLGPTFDIHTGGIDHLSVHHPNEIAQSEAATGKPFARFWIHHAFLKVDDRKMSKSLKNFYTVDDVEEKGFDPMALRYFYLTAHYRKSLNFTWQALTAAQHALTDLRSFAHEFRKDTRNALSEEKLTQVEVFRQKFIGAIANDMNMPRGLSALWQMVRSNIPSADKYDLLMDFDEVLGLGLSETSVESIVIPNQIKELVQKRELFRKQGEFDEADTVRKEIEEKGFLVEDTPEGPHVKKKTS